MHGSSIHFPFRQEELYGLLLLTVSWGIPQEEEGKTERLHNVVVAKYQPLPTWCLYLVHAVIGEDLYTFSK